MYPKVQGSSPWAGTRSSQLAPVLHPNAFLAKVETADVVLMRSDPLDVATAFAIGRGTLRKMRQNLGWAVGYNAIALPIAAGVFQPAFGLVLRPEIAAISMSGSSMIVAVNALLLKRLRLPKATDISETVGSENPARSPERQQ